jgi:hypothetical protein
MPSRRFRWLGLIALVAPACGSGGGNGGAPFTAATPVADVCSMLALSDVQVLVPGAPAGAPLAPSDDADVWGRTCAWQAGGQGVSLLVAGALNSKGDVVLDTTVEATSNGMRQATAVSGLGDKAVYLNNIGLDQILNAKKGSEVVSVAAYGFTPEAPEASLQPLVVEALAKL